jgi:hypothetical protein
MRRLPGKFRMKLLNSFPAFFARRFGLDPSAGDWSLHVVSPRVLVIHYEPVVDPQGSRLTARSDWRRLADLIPGSIAELREVS